MWRGVTDNLNLGNFTTVLSAWHVVGREEKRREYPASNNKLLISGNINWRCNA
jgi:hypothetical protein